MFDFPVKKLVYKGEKTREISLPIGGIGAGCIGITGWGSLFEFEIFNRPNKLSTNGFTFFAVKAEKDGKLCDARILMNDPKFTRTGFSKRPDDEFYDNYGWGPGRETMAGMPHFHGDTFTASYPFAELDFEDEKFPGKVHLTAFNPFIPLNDADSSIPAAFMEYEVENNTDSEIKYTLCGTFKNPHKTFVNMYEKSKRVSDMHTIRMLSCDDSLPAHEKGEVCLSVLGDGISYQEYMYKGGWFDTLTTFWNDFTSPKPFENTRCMTDDSAHECVLASGFTLAPGEKRTVKFIISWHFPISVNYWNPVTREEAESVKYNKDGDEIPPKTGLTDADIYKMNTWKNYYTRFFDDALECAEYCYIHYERMKSETELFRNLLFSSTLPESFIDAVSANISILKSPTCLRNEDGSFLAWEGCGIKGGSCEGSCTHVWSYAYALAFLFPSLERSMRENEFKYSMDKYGAIQFRIPAPLGRYPKTYFPCADGQFAGIMKIYRDFKLDGDRDRLIEMWPDITRSLEFAWHKKNPFRWDPDKTGVLSGRQHHTLDMELFSPNSWLAGMYLGALKAGSEMAKIVGDKKRAAEYLSIYEKGRAWVNENLYNGKYFIQKIDLNDMSLLHPFVESEDKDDPNDKINATYRSVETGELKYQYSEGCMEDQCLAQYHANLIGLGDIFDKEKLISALDTIYENNFKKSMRDFANPCRNYAINDEKGLVICEYPEGARVPKFPIPYAGECMNGFEYSTAVLMLGEGMVDRAVEIVDAVRERYDGEYRNPWNEFECGSNYARSMASYSLLNAACGFEYDMYEKFLGFTHVKEFEVNGVFRCFVCMEKGYGFVEVGPDYLQFKLLRGEGFKLRKIRTSRKPLKVYVAGRDYGFTPREDNIAELDNDVVINTERDIMLVIEAR